MKKYLLMMVSLLVMCPVISVCAMMFSLFGAPAVSAIDYYWEEPLAVAGNTCVLIPFNENSGTSFYGQSTNGAYAMLGSFRSAGSAAWVTGKFGSALSFNGATNQGVNIQQNGKLALTDENASWEFWFKLGKKATNDQFIAQVGSSWQIKVSPSGQIRISANHGGTWRGVQSATALSTGVWTHIIFTRGCTNKAESYADYTYSVYTNGTPANSQVFTNVAKPSANTASMTLGYSIWNTAHLNGVIDDFRISRGIIRRIFLNSDNETVFQNPHMGFAWATDPHKYLTWEKYDKPQNPRLEFQVIKLIVKWADVEPSPGQYDWTEVDQAIQELRARGFSINVRFLLSNGNEEKGVPSWLYAAPYNVGYVDVDNNCKELIPTKFPYFWDTNFQARARNILSQFAARYETNDISWIDVRIYGHTGEWDSGNNPFPWELFPFQSKSNTLHQLVDIYLDVFGDTGIPVSINASGWEYSNACQVPIYSNQPLSHCLGRLALGHAYDNGFGIRKDNIRGWAGWAPDWIQTGVSAIYRDSNFVVGETGNGWSPDTDPPSNIVNNALISGMTCMAYGGHRVQKDTFVTNYPAEYALGMKNFGYRLIPSQITFPSCIQTGQVFSMDINWENLAVGRLIKPGYHLQVYLKDSSGVIRWQRSDLNFNPSLIVNGNTFDPANPDHWHDNGIQYPIHHTLARIPSTQTPGTYDLYIAIVDKNDVPAIRLPIDGDDGSWRYYAGNVDVVE